MNRIKNKSLFFLCLFLSPVVLGQLPSRPTSYVTDTAGAMDAQTRQQIEAMLVQLNQKTQAEVAVVTIRDLGGQDIETAAVELFEKWGIGKKGEDNGVLFLIAPQERKVRIEVGYGLEGVIPDATAKQILEQGVLPAFRNGQMAQGILIGSAVIAQAIAQDKGVTLQGGPQLRQPGRRPQRKASLLERLLGLLFFIVMIPIIIRHPWLLLLFLSSGRRGGSWGGGGFGGGFGGFGGGMSGGGGASGGW